MRKEIPNLIEDIKNNSELIKYIATYVNEEISRGKQITAGTIYAAIDAFEGGAR